MISMIAAFFLALLTAAQPVWGAPTGEKAAKGYSVQSQSECKTFDAKVTEYVHDATGAKVIVIANDDPNKYFMLDFATCAYDNSGIAHVFEHAAMNGSKKYPSRTLSSALFNRAYVTFANALTQDKCTDYPIASLSEEELLKLEDYYTDLCFNPLILTDEDIFRSEAWRYELFDESSDINVNGTIYSEMKGSYTADIAAVRNAVGLLYPSNPSAFEAGGIPEDITKLTYEDVIEFHDKYYHPSNCVAYLYGDIKDVTPHLELLASYFDGYKERKIEERSSVKNIGSGYYIEKKYDFPASAGADVSNRTEMVYAVDAGALSDEDLIKLYAFCSCCNSQSSSVMLRLRSLYPLSTFRFGIESDRDGVILYVCAHGMNTGDAGMFRDSLSKIFADMAAGGISSAEIDRFKERKEIEAKLSREGSVSSRSLLTNTSNMRSCGRSEMFYMNMRDAYIDMGWFDNDYVKSVAQNMLEDPEKSAMSIVSPKPGLIEENEKKLAAKLSSMRASMSDDQIKQMIKDTERVTKRESDDPEKYLEQLSVVKVSDLSEGSVKKYRTSDTTDRTGIRRIGVETSTEGINVTRLYLDAAGLSEDMLPYLALYTDLVNGHFISTGTDTRNDLPGRISDVTVNGMEISLGVTSLYDDYRPYVCIEFMSTPDKLQDAYELMYDRLFDSRFDDAADVAEGVASVKNVIRKNIENNPHLPAVYSAYAADAKGAAYYYMTHYGQYYDFLSELEKKQQADYKDVCDKLSKIGAYIMNAPGAVLGYAATAKERSAYLDTANMYLAALGNEKHTAVDLGKVKNVFPLAIALDRPVSSNVIAIGDAASAGFTGTASDKVAMAVMTDMYLKPVIRDTLGAYGCTYSDDKTAAAFYSTSDPQTTKTLKVYDGMGEAWSKIMSEMDEKTLEGYILTMHSKESLSEGDISDAMGIISDMVKGDGSDRRIKRLRQLKAIKLSDLDKYGDVFANMAENGHRVSSGNIDAAAEKQYGRTVYMSIT